MNADKIIRSTALNVGLGSILYIPEKNIKNPTQCCGKFGTIEEWQCMFLAHDDVFDKGICEFGGGYMEVHDVYTRPQTCPLRNPCLDFGGCLNDGFSWQWRDKK